MVINKKNIFYKEKKILKPKRTLTTTSVKCVWSAHDRTPNRAKCRANSNVCNTLPLTFTSNTIKLDNGMPNWATQFILSFQMTSSVAPVKQLLFIPVFNKLNSTVILIFIEIKCCVGERAELWTCSVYARVFKTTIRNSLVCRFVLFIYLFIQ